jgi:hypothetical protein
MDETVAGTRRRDRSVAPTSVLQGVMMYRRAASALALVLVAATLAAPTTAEAAASANASPADPRAGGPAAALHRNLVAAQQPGQLDGFLFGQQHANWDSKRYRSIDDRVIDWRGPRTPEFDGFVSDIELATTLLPGLDPHSPAVYGFSLRTALRLGGEEQIRYADRIVDAYAAGGVVTIHFPADNPVTGGDHKDVGANALCALATNWDDPVPESADAVRAWQGELSEVADFLRLVNSRWRDPDTDGVDERSGRVAMVFRPFHEMLRVRHWWSAAYYRQVPGVCDVPAAKAFRSVWRQTFDYLTGTDALDIHGLLFAWSPDRPTEVEGWEAYYPNAGLADDNPADYVDVIAFDVYETSPDAFAAQLVEDAAAVTAFNDTLPPKAREVVAVGEFGPRSGLSTVSEGNFFVESVIRPLSQAGLADELAYAMTWSNMDHDRYWVPLPCYNMPQCESVDPPDTYYGRPTGDPIRGFRAFVHHPSTVFLEDLPAWWERPDTSIPFQAGETPTPVLHVLCWAGDPGGRRPDAVTILDTCPVAFPIGNVGFTRG